ncbi:FadR/GntR family transcriptional regulator [Ahrensia marina]|jgi:GntR family transcriptional repressor for pyruvate dehydrogenase complex|uniref:Pyruvate dehydrogenase complex repressor n=1 Tax=Ahrensia marina TaxID=1514904 RepID=A0A0N0VMD4_9HYPH|nr:FadR/GntR family transcriptional regulator [Ahrensia marina]KPB02534.1 GntR family transcriptional regulator [Ahrensia marina]
MGTTIFSQINHARTADEVCAQIETLILEGVLRVGDKLPGERDLSEQLGISRPILREALKDLEARELLVTRHGGGTFVADVIGDVFSKTMLELIADHPKATSDYLEYRREVEAIAAAYAARRATDDDRALLTEIILRMEEAHKKEDFRDEAAIDVEFHQAICEAAHNLILLHTLRSCYRLLTNGTFFSRSLVYRAPGARTLLLKQHRAIYEAIMEADPEAAAAAAAAHMEFVEESKREAEKVGAWQTVSKLRRQMRNAD